MTWNQLSYPKNRPVALVGAIAALVVLSAVTQSGEVSHAAAQDGTTQGGPAQSAWTSVFRDNFSGAANAPLGRDWQYDLGTSYPGGAAQWGTGEIETATDSTANVYQDGSRHLILQPIR